MRGTTNHRLANLAAAVLSVLAVVGIVFLGMRTAAGGKRPKPPPATGLIYFKDYPAVYSMRPDGSERTLVSDTGGALSEASQLRHGGMRWFFSALPIGGETYPDGGQRYELFAQSEAGDIVQLSDDATLQSSDSSGQSGYRQERWSVGDTRVSWLGRRWGLDSDGSDAVTELGLFAINLPADVAELTEPSIPVRVPIAYPTIDTSQEGLLPDPAGYDWSPDGTAVVLATQAAGIWVADLLTHTGDEDVQPFQIAPAGHFPRWSPDDTRIAFYDLGVNTITPIGTNHAIVVPNKERGGWQGSIKYRYPRWSPDGAYLTFEKWRHGGESPFPTIDICRSTVEGRSLQALTNDIKDPLSSLGWAAD